MKLLCDACEEVVPLTELRQEGGALVFTCPGCGASGRLSAGPAGPAAGSPPPSGASTPAATPAPPAATDPPPTSGPRLTVLPSPERAPLPTEPPPTHCPKCVEPRAAQALSCPRCGLVFANFRPEGVAPRPELLERWQGLREEWDDPDAHERLLQHASRLGALAQLGRLYRIKLAHSPDDVRAQAGRERIIAAVTSALVPASASDRDGGPPQRGRGAPRTPAELSRRRKLFGLWMAVMLSFLFFVVCR